MKNAAFKKVIHEIEADLLTPSRFRRLLKAIDTTLSHTLTATRSPRRARAKAIKQH